MSDLVERVTELLAKCTAGPWHPCQHLKGVEEDLACSCGYRGVIYGPDHDVAYAICQPGHEPPPKGQEGTEPARYPREVEIANMQLVALAPEMAAALQSQALREQRLRGALEEAGEALERCEMLGEWLKKNRSDDENVGLVAADLIETTSQARTALNGDE